MEAFLAATLFSVDALCVAAAGWLLARSAEGEAAPEPSCVERGLAWIAASLVLVASGSALLGLVGALGPRGQLGLHAAVLLALVLLRRARLAGDTAMAGAWLRRLGWHLFRGPWRAGVVVLTGFVVLHAVIAAWAPPAVFDALTYRLPRIAQWLQDGVIAHLVTDDPRLNYMPVGPDLVIAWLIGVAPRGYLLAGLAQTAGGVLLLGATWIFARRTALGGWAALGAVALVAGMANVAPQFSSLHTDLFTAGVFAASLALGVAALERRRGSWLAGAGLGLALGSKGTMLYVAPAAALWGAWFLWQHRPDLRALRSAVLGGFVVLALVAGPLWARNLAAYGRLSAPAEAVQEHYGAPVDLATRAEKLALNLRTMAVQLLDPHSQPPWLRDAVAPLRAAAGDDLPHRDPFAFEDIDRAGSLQVYFDMAEPDADFAGPGLLLVVLAGLGAGMAVWRWRAPGAPLVLLWTAGLGAYVVTQNALYQWHPWGFRYAVLVAPWLALVAAWAFERAPRILRLAGWTLCLAAAVWTAGETTLRCRQGAWFSLSNVGRVQSGWPEWAESLAPAGSALRLAMPVNSPLARFYRGETPRSVRTEKLTALAGRPAEECVAERPGEWLIVPAATFIGREGRVAARTFLYLGDERQKISVAAYRALAPGEVPPPVIYSERALEVAGGFGRRLLVRAWQGAVLITVANPSAAVWEFDLAGARGRLVPGAAATVEVTVSDSALNAIELRYTRAGAAAEDGLRPYVRRIEPVSAPAARKP